MHIINVYANHCYFLIYSTWFEKAPPTRSVSADDSKKVDLKSQLHPSSWRRANSEPDPNQKEMYSGVPIGTQPKEVDKDDGQGLLQACISEEWDIAKALISSGSTLEAQDMVNIHL